MKKNIWILLLLTALASAGWFVGKPVLEKYLAEKQPAEQLGNAESAAESFAEEGWVRQEKFTYRRRDIPSLEADFEAIGRMIRGARRYFLQCFTDRDSVPFGNLHAPSAQDLRAYADIVRPYVPDVNLRGVD
jgi:hypothetical protein